MYREKLDLVFKKAPNHGEYVIDKLKDLVRYQNFCIEEQILLQARNQGVDIPAETIMNKNKQKVVEHDKAIAAVCAINDIAHRCGCMKVFDFEPHYIEGDLSRYDQNDHAKVAYIVADFVNEYYSLGLEMGKYDRALDDTTFAKLKTIKDDEYLGATEYDLPKAEYYEERINTAPEEFNNKIERDNKHLAALEGVLDKTGSVNITLHDGVEMSIIKANDYDVTIKSQKDFKDTSGILRSETIAGFESTGPKEMSAKDLLMAQIKEIIKDNGGISYKSVQEHKLNDFER